MQVTVCRGDLVEHGWRAEAIGPEEREPRPLAIGRFRLVSPVRYRWSTWFPPDYPFDMTRAYGPRQGQHAFQVFTQWHQSSLTGSPPLEFVIQSPAAGESGYQLKIGIVDRTGTRRYVRLADLVLGQWQDFDVIVGWSSKHGYLNVSHNGRTKVFRPEESDGLLSRSAATITRLQTIYRGQFNYFKMGLYRPCDAPPDPAKPNDTPPACVGAPRCDPNNATYAQADARESILFHSRVARMTLNLAALGGWVRTVRGR